MKTCFIFGSMATDKIPLTPSEGDLIIAADGGLKTLEKFNIKPDLIVGDFDSLNYIPKGDNVIKHPVQKDETDTILAVDTAINKGYYNFVVYGCLGGRLDHTVASIQTASYIAEKGGNAVFIDCDTFLTVIKNSEIKFNEENEGLISIFAVSGIAEGVNAKNLLYALDNAKLTPDYPLGVSNEFTGENADICVSKGKLCIIWNGNKGSFKIGG